jgi:drug/metabolite transporter (DMT)-like permease
MDTPDTVALRRNRRHAILCILGASATFAVAAACVKVVAPRIPTLEIVFFRNAFMLPALLPLIIRAGGWRALRTRRPLGHAARTVFGLLGMVSAFYGYSVLPLATVTALGFAMPLFLTVLSIPLLGERVGPRRGGAVLVGLVGVLAIVRPWEGGADMPLGAMAFVLSGVLGWALAMITIRRMGAAGESNIAIVAWFGVGAMIVTGFAMLPGWVTPSGWDWLFLVAVGVVSALAQMLMTEAYRSGEATLVAPFEYGGILYTMALGLVIWGEWPAWMDFAGIAVLILSGLYIWDREVTRARDR